MTTYPSTSRWKPIELPILNALTTNTQKLTPQNWPSFAHRGPQFNRVFANSEPKLNSTSPSSSIVATLITERIDSTDAPNIYNYNCYLVAETASGGLFLSPPMRTNNPAHHSSLPSTLYYGLDAPL